jgi:uncharacterized protein YkwD
MLAVSAGSLGGTWASAVGAGGRATQAVGASCRDAKLRPSQANVSRVAAATLCLIERERRRDHLLTLRSNSSLGRIAASQANDMVIGDYFGDNSPAGATPWQRITTSHYASGARSLRAAQNIGWGSGSLATPEAMVRTWMRSPPHRQIMLTSGYRDVGIGVAPAAPHCFTGGAPGATYTVEFAARG